MFTVKLSSRPNKRSISFRGVGEEFHMMLVWDKMKPLDFKNIYKEIEIEITTLIQAHNNTIAFTPIYSGTNSTYGQLDEWMTNYIYSLRDKFEWVYKEKDLPFMVENQTDKRILFAHISRRELKEDSTLLKDLLNVESILFKVV